jgi:phenylacetate-CoA ligase
VLARLAAERSAGRLRASPTRIQTTSERLTPELRATIDAGFGVPVVDVFGCSAGLMGITAPDSDVFTFNSDMFLTELVDDDNRPVTRGTRSSAVLLTSLGTTVQPLIRYRLPDRLRQVTGGDTAMLQATVDGLDVHLFRYRTVSVHPVSVSAMLLRRPEIFDHQIIQTTAGVRVAYVAADDVDEAALRHSVEAALRSAGLPDPEVILNRMDTLDRFRDTGKLRRYVPL